MIDEKYYLAYVLGYDLLHQEIRLSNNNECDTSFENCLEIIDSFLNSELYLNAKCSTYEALETWLAENYDYVIDTLNGKEI